MLSPSEFTVGKVGTAMPLSLILPTSKYEETLLVGQLDELPTAVFLSGQHKSMFFKTEGNESWGGLIIPSVRIEIDETSFVDEYSSEAPMLSVTRTDTKLVVAARSERSFGQVQITLHEGLDSTGEAKAKFANWQIVLGKGQDKRVLWTAT
ncbi:hypothetical protein [Litoreibacter roseus]|uniref:Uncharacterized protein n=1 Tax=Litoreibacter roseus TaxID=2601869 RepID=A0A6N6JP60_9RHOB|nr:hypothetical protein [Litoreibacter roseus]GFE67252.1 hypothetical protein KIN_43260 [Litoreibacter roseus]